MFCHSHVEPFSGEVAALPRDLPRCACESLGCASGGVSAGSWSLPEAMGTLFEFNASMRVLVFDGLVVVFGVMRSFGY